MTAEVLSRSEFVRIRGFRYHMRRWGDPTLPKLFLLHGWLDVSETFHYLVQPLLDRWQVLAPDWRGFGYSEWQPGGYWYQDSLADLEALLDQYAPDEAVILIGHSFGAGVSAHYAGVRPRRIARLLLLDGPFMPSPPPDRAPGQLANWLDQLRDPPKQKVYKSFQQLADSVRRLHVKLSPERALFVAHCWGHEDGHGHIRLCADPQHRLNWPTLYRWAEHEPVWKLITARTLHVDGGGSALRKLLNEEEIARRRALIRDSRTAVIENAGHMLHFEQPEATAAVIREFLLTT